jgi:hypothetical protein
MAVPTRHVRALIMAVSLGVIAVAMRSDSVAAQEAQACTYIGLYECPANPKGYCSIAGEPDGAALCEECNMGPEFCGPHDHILACCTGDPA